MRIGSSAVGSVGLSRVIATAVLVGFLATPRSGAAASGQKPTPMVEILLAGTDGKGEAALTEGLRRSWERLGVDMRVTSVAGIDVRDVVAGDVLPAGRLAKVWIDLVTPNVATVYVTESRNVFRRRLKFKGPSQGPGLDSVELDLLEVVVTSAVETILSGRQLGVAREEFKRSLSTPAAAPPTTRTPPQEEPKEPPEPPQQTAPPPQTTPVPPPPAEPPVETPPIESSAVSTPQAAFLRAALAYQVLLVSSTQATHGPGLLLERQRNAVRLGLGLFGQFPYQVTGTGETLRLTTAGFRLSVGRAFFWGSTTTFIAAVAAGIDVTRVTPTAGQDGAIIPSAPFWVVEPIARPFTQFERRFGRFSVGAMLGIDVDIKGASYVKETATGKRAIWTPWRVRPLALLSAGFDY